MTVETICEKIYIQRKPISVTKVKRGFAILAVRDELFRHGIIVEWERDRRKLCDEFTDITSTFQARFSPDPIAIYADDLVEDLKKCMHNAQRSLPIRKKQKGSTLLVPDSTGNELENGSNSTSDDTIPLLPATASTDIFSDLYGMYGSTRPQTQKMPQSFWASRTNLNIFLFWIVHRCGTVRQLQDVNPIMSFATQLVCRNRLVK